MSNSQYKLYCDLEGVLIDFDARFKQMTGKNPHIYRLQNNGKKFWEYIHTKIGAEFWTEALWTKDGRRLWNLISNHNPTVITSPGVNNISKSGKEAWIKNNLSPLPSVKFELSEEKPTYSKTNSIMIDDRKKVVDQWISRGGIGIRYSEYRIDKVMSKLKQLGYE